MILEYYSSHRHNIEQKQFFESANKDIEACKLIAINTNRDLGFKFTEVRSVFANRLKSAILANLKYIIPSELFYAYQETIIGYIKNTLELHASVK